jgi:hypothetical protein
MVRLSVLREMFKDFERGVVITGMEYDDDEDV